VHARPMGETDDVRVTIPENPFWPATVIVRLPLAPESTLSLVGLAETVKLGAALTLYVTVTE
jgi:hypothetical protein